MVDHGKWNHGKQNHRKRGTTLMSMPSRARSSVCVCVLSHFSSVWLFANPMDCSPPGSSVQGILQARMLAGVGCHSLLGGIVPTQGLNWHLLHVLLRQAGSSPLTPPGKPQEQCGYYLFLFVFNANERTIKPLWLVFVSQSPKTLRDDPNRIKAQNQSSVL